MATRSPNRLRKPERGQVLVLFALASFVLVGFMALALDVGYLLTERREAQNAADAAALAGGLDLMRGEPEDTIEASAKAYAGLNGVPEDPASINVGISGTSQDGQVEVEISNPVEQFFLGAIYTGDWQVSARAVAEVNDDVNGKYGLLALEPPGMYVNGNVDINVIDGSAMSNGDVSRDGDANIFTASGSIDAVGEVDEGTHWSAGAGFNDARPVSPDPYLDAPRPPKPAEPGKHDCEETGKPKDCTLWPGLYEDMGTIKIRKNATMMPGLYYFENTRIVVQSEGGVLEGDGVLLYFAGNPATTYIQPGTAEFSFTAPDESPYPDGPDGMTLWIDNCSEFNSQGNNDYYIEGVFYAPCSRVWLHGTPDGVAVSGQVIVGVLDIRGTSQFIVQYEDYVFTPRLELYLVE